MGQADWRWWNFPGSGHIEYFSELNIHDNETDHKIYSSKNSTMYNEEIATVIEFLKKFNAIINLGAPLGQRGCNYHPNIEQQLRINMLSMPILKKEQK